MSKQILAVHDVKNQIYGATISWFIENDSELLKRIRNTISSRFELYFTEKPYFNASINYINNYFKDPSYTDKKIKYIGIVPLYYREKLLKYTNIYSRHNNSIAKYLLFINNKPITSTCITCNNNIKCLEEGILVFTQDCKYSIERYQNKVLGTIPTNELGTSIGVEEGIETPYGIWRDKASMIAVAIDSLKDTDLTEKEINDMVSEYLEYNTEEFNDLLAETIHTEVAL